MPTVNPVKKKPEISFFVFYSSIFHCGPWRNSIRLWTQRGYKANVFQLKDLNLHEYKSEFDSQYTLYEIENPYLIHIICRILVRGFQLFNHIGLKKLADWGNDLSYLLKSFYFVLACYWKIDKKKRHVLIGGDPQGLLAAYLVSRLKGNMLIYWSLELWIEKDIKEFGRKVFKKIERWCNQRTPLTIEFGEKRCELLQKENRLDGRTMISIPNSPLGKAAIKRNYYFNKKFNISLDKKIVLYAGGLGVCYGLEELLKYADTFPSSCVFVIHGRSEANVNHLKQIAALTNLPVYFSLDPVPFDLVDMIYTSGDIGLQVWPPIITNLEYSDLSSGKMFHYMKAGVPVIVRNLPGMKEIVERSGIGLCIEDMKDIGKAAERIINEESKYQANCIRSFKKYQFELHHKKFIDFVENHIIS